MPSASSTAASGEEAVSSDGQRGEQLEQLGYVLRARGDGRRHLVGLGVSPELLRQARAGLLDLLHVRPQTPGQVIHSTHLVEHGPADAVLGEALEADVARGVVALRRVEQPHGTG